MNPVKRRLFIRLFIGLAAAVSVGWLPFRSRSFTKKDRALVLRSALFDACGSQALPARLGRACRTQGHTGRLYKNTEELVSSFGRATDAGVQFAQWCKLESIADFRAGRVVRVDGWVISETEFLLFSGFS
jgi:hypothetical protein